ncbi:MAG: hypothetical protein E6R05_00075 [Candidatus Moraniibacteriota bacterium]|nr:MAG: hypothetical protein E6R05_00075 [Candidatus Moranbacteria bacterium]
MKVYFTAAISNTTSDAKKSYSAIINTLEKMGHTVIYSEAINSGNVLENQSSDDAIANQKKLSKWKKQSDVVLVEASVPSFGVGQEITEALTDNKQVIVLYKGVAKPHILVSQNQESLYFAEYGEDNLKKVLEDYIEYARANSDTRFNFFISPQIGYYLDWVSRKRKLPRAVYLRRLIEEEMKNNKEYQENVN